MFLLRDIAVIPAFRTQKGMRTFNIAENKWKKSSHIWSKSPLSLEHIIKNSLASNGIVVKHFDDLFFISRAASQNILSNIRSITLIGLDLSLISVKTLVNVIRPVKYTIALIEIKHISRIFLALEMIRSISPIKKCRLHIQPDINSIITAHQTAVTPLDPLHGCHCDCNSKAPVIVIRSGFYRTLRRKSFHQIVFETSQYATYQKLNYYCSRITLSNTNILDLELRQILYQTFWNISVRNATIRGPFTINLLSSLEDKQFSLIQLFI